MAEMYLVLHSSPGSVTRQDFYYCQVCQNPIDLSLVQKRLELNKDDLLCAVCGARTPFAALLTPTISLPCRAPRATVNNTKSRGPNTNAWMSAKQMLTRKQGKGVFDAFLSHNAEDKVEVEAIAHKLRCVGIRPWLDKWEVKAGKSWIKALQRAIEKAHSAVVFLGPTGEGPWQKEEVEAALERFASRRASIVPVLLPGVPREPDLPVFLSTKAWVDMRTWRQNESDAFYRLVCGILGRAPGDSPVIRFTARDVWKWQKGGR